MSHKTYAPMTPSDRLNYAWELAQGKHRDETWMFSKAQIADWANIPIQIVSEMRSVAKILWEEHPQVNVSKLSWREAVWIAGPNKTSREPRPSENAG